VNDSIRAVFFDFDGTLAFHEPDSFDMVSAFCAEIGQPLGPEAERRGRRAEHRFFAAPDIRDRFKLLAGDDFWLCFNRIMLETMGVEGDLNQLAMRVTDRFSSLEQEYRCPETVPLTLAELRARGYRLGLITNRQGVERLYALLDVLLLNSFFDVRVVAGELGFRKPEPGIFSAALERAGITAAQALHVGDNYWADVVGAQSSGVKPVLLDPHHIFPEADCLILERVDELLTWLP